MRRMRASLPGPSGSCRHLLLALGVVLSACMGLGDPATDEVGATRIETDMARKVEVTNVTAQVQPGAALLAKAQRRLLTSADAFRRFFGQEPPASIDFDDRWVVFASLGPQGSSGHSVDVQMRLHPSGRSLRAGIVVTAPGRGCANAAVVEVPYFVGTIPAGGGHDIAPQAIRYFRKVERRDCAENLCGPSLESALGAATTAPNGDPVLAVSESDYPYTPVNLGQAPAEITVATVAQAALASGIFDPYLAELRQNGNDVPATYEEILAKLLDDEDGQHESWGTWSASSGDFVEWSTEEPFGEITDEYDRNQSLGRLHMSEVLRQNLEDVTLIYLFDVEVKLLIVGRTSCGQLAGYLTTLIWT